jgi:hypothetical protein
VCPLDAPALIARWRLGVIRAVTPLNDILPIDRLLRWLAVLVEVVKIHHQRAFRLAASVIPVRSIGVEFRF